MRIIFIIHKYGVPLDDPCCYPLGAMYISAALKVAGHNVKVLNHNLHDYDLDAELGGAEVALFTGFEDFKARIRMDAVKCKKRGIHTIVGGALATFSPDEMLEYVDTVVIGEGETAVIAALMENGKIYGVPADINTLPLPDYDGFGIDEYHARHGQRYMGVLTSRGCPFHCSFCSSVCRYRERDLRFVFEEIDLYIAKYGLQTVVFNDNTLNVKKNRFMSICEGMKERGLMWGAAIRCDVWDEEMARTAKQSGLIYCVVGVESFDQVKLDQMNKRITVDQIINCLDLLEKHDIDYHGNILVGFEGETYADIMAEFDRIPRCYKVFPAMVQPFVGTGDGKDRALTRHEYTMLDDSFREYIELKGKYCYPDLQRAVNA